MALEAVPLGFREDSDFDLCIVVPDGDPIQESSLSTHAPYKKGGAPFTQSEQHDRLVEMDYAIKMANQQALYAKTKEALKNHPEQVAMRKAKILALSNTLNRIFEDPSNVKEANEKLIEMNKIYGHKLNPADLAYLAGDPHEFVYTGFLTEERARTMIEAHKEFRSANPDLCDKTNALVLSRLQNLSGYTPAQASTEITGLKIRSCNLARLASMHSVFSAIGLGEEWPSFALSKRATFEYAFGNGHAPDFQCLAYQLALDDAGNQAGFDCKKASGDEGLSNQIRELYNEAYSKRPPVAGP